MMCQNDVAISLETTLEKQRPGENYLCSLSELVFAVFTSDQIRLAEFLPDITSHLSPTTFKACSVFSLFSNTSRKTDRETAF